MQLLVDTHLLLWWLADSPSLPAEARTLIADAENTVFVSAVSMWDEYFNAHEPMREVVRYAALATPVVWRCVADVERPYAAEVGGARWRLVLGDFPAEPLYALEVEGTVVGTFDGWPAAWTRP